MPLKIQIATPAATTSSRTIRPRIAILSSRALPSHIAAIRIRQTGLKIKRETAVAILPRTSFAVSI